MIPVDLSQTVRVGSMIQTDPGSRSLGSDPGIHFRDPRTCLPRGRELESLLDDLDLVCLNDGSPTFQSSSYNSFSSIDLGVVSASIATWFQFSADTDPYFSDHFPIRLHFTFSQSILPPPGIPVRSLKRADWNRFQSLVDDRIEETDPNEIASFLQVILEAAEETVPISKPSSRQRLVPWWSPECARAVAKRRRALRLYQKHITTETRLAYQVASRHCRAVLLQAKKSTWQDFVSQFNRFTPLTKIWKFLKAFSHKRDPICAFPQLLANGSLISSPDEVVMVFADYFASASSNEIFTSSQRSRFSSLLKPCKFALDSSQTYNANFTFEELDSAICSSGHTSVGPDGIHYDFFRNISTLSKTKLLQCFNAAWNSGKYPDQWLSSFIIPIPKKGNLKT